VRHGKTIAEKVSTKHFPRQQCRVKKKIYEKWRKNLEQVQRLRKIKHETVML
jgi:ribosomal protein L32E